jgi:hypothetical protein
MPIQDNITTQRMFSPIFYFYYFHLISLPETGNTYEYVRFQILMEGIMTSTVF